MPAAPCLVRDNVLGDPTRPQLTYGDFANVPEWEYSAQAHYFFDTGDSSGLVDRTGRGNDLTLQDAAPTYSANGLTLPAAAGDGLLLPVTPALAYSVLMVVEWPTTSGSGLYAPLFGNAAITGDGTMVSANVSSIGNDSLFTRVSGGDGSKTTALPGGNIADATIMCVGFAVDFTGGTKLRRLYANGASTDITDTTAPATAGSNAMALGNGYYGSLFNSPIKIYSAAYFDEVLTEADFEAVAARDVVRWGRRSVTVALP